MLIIDVDGAPRYGANSNIKILGESLVVVNCRSLKLWRLL